jgi:hypothetical protein
MADGWVPPSTRVSTSTVTTTTTSLRVETRSFDSSDFEDSVNHLTEHGYGWDTGTQIVCFANRAQINEIRKWRFGQVNRNTVTANYDFIPAIGQPALLVPNAEGLLGGQAPSTWNGLRVTGAYMDVMVIEEPLMPAGYMLFLSTGGVNMMRTSSVFASTLRHPGGD